MKVIMKKQSAISWNSTSNTCSRAVFQAPTVEEPFSLEASESSCKEQGKVFWGEECYDEYPFAKKKRWTPAEANEWLHDGNDNFVVITFKK